MARANLDSRKLRDEIDILKEKAAKVEMLEDKIKKMSQKAETTSDLRDQIKVRYLFVKSGILFGRLNPKKIKKSPQRLQEENENLSNNKNVVEQNLNKSLVTLKTTVEKMKQTEATLLTEKTALTAQLKQKEFEVDTLSSEKRQLEVIFCFGFFYSVTLFCYN